MFASVESTVAAKLVLRWQCRQRRSTDGRVGKTTQQAAKCGVSNTLQLCAQYFESMFFHGAPFSQKFGL
eukprot:NODE_17391_length_945_cov_3.885086.p4 GENE.NODE_17391_length_945_cov_3.885086~~NODE_17391_length_945_cov_3.885086.p4  ORF type:complete len:69 (+),score=6.09 NODE_17391_length_945_cov_3.885086:342-548(+)